MTTQSIIDYETPEKLAMAEKRQYPKRFISREAPQPWRLQHGDIELLRCLHEYRLLEARQLARLLGRSVRAIQQRLRFMFDEKPRLITKPPRQHSHLRDPGPDIYGLANGGAAVLTERAIISGGNRDWTRMNRDLKNRSIQHTMMISHFMVCLTLALRDPSQWQLTDWIPESKPLVYRFLAEGEKHSIDPDGFLTLERSGDPEPYRHYALEADQSTEWKVPFSAKLQSYWIGRSDYYDRLGISSLKVCTVTKSRERRDNLQEYPSQIDGRGTGSPMFLFASQDCGASPKRCDSCKAGLTCEQGFSLAEPQSILRPIWRCGLASCDTWHSLVE